MSSRTACYVCRFLKHGMHQSAHWFGLLPPRPHATEHAATGSGDSSGHRRSGLSANNNAKAACMLSAGLYMPLMLPAVPTMAKTFPASAPAGPPGSGQASAEIALSIGVSNASQHHDLISVTCSLHAVSNVLSNSELQSVGYCDATEVDDLHNIGLSDLMLRAFMESCCSEMLQYQYPHVLLQNPRQSVSK